MKPTIRARIRDGDRDAFGELFDEYARAIHHHAYRLTGDWSTAEDVVSLTFLEAWRLRERVDSDESAGPLRAWLYGVATNVARNVRRAARRHASAMARLPKPQPVPDHADEVVATIDERERLSMVRDAVARLRKHEREVLTLCVWSGFGYTEAAQALGVPVGTVRSRLSRARKRLEKLVAAGRVRPLAEPAEEKREPVARPGQTRGDRTNAVRFAQETPR
ncbi:RNA polymerase sigma factor [Phytomonospora endophytica]|uniref:RNA polymerase sigma-70 factor (ECF subfamily) n=1 Tax=Phytomonospora endophytica TaxID=714109 RepID=A0A841FID8_9ACTN|nr:RNA polymerase sigma factor [Phytomonospora endophytica]MBB6034723.1 RNA polymerase sigma-70 factor (ECF subfamily) [Phytomonospora endophytica]GIG69074.1 siderophore-interacting protein [Phytomonospora endophytica]